MYPSNIYFGPKVVPVYVLHGQSVLYLGVSENRGPEYSTLNSRMLIIRTPKQGTLIFGKSHLGTWTLRGMSLKQTTAARSGNSCH